MAVIKGIGGREIVLDDPPDTFDWLYSSLTGDPALLARLHLDMAKTCREAGDLAKSLRHRQAATDLQARVPAGTVAGIFNAYAHRFDTHLVDVLEYRAHEHVRDALVRHAGASRGTLDVLDLGCGTGLCGPLVRPYARRLVGVDLSSGMLERAHGRAVYDDLRCAELTAYLGETADRFDALVAADVLPYIGNVEPLFRGARRVLRRGGLLVVSVERGGAAGYLIQEDERYRHSAAYLRATARVAGFRELAVDAVTLRMESDRPVAGLVWSGRLQ